MAKKKSSAKTVLITGAGGALGERMVEETLARGCKVTAVDLPGAPIKETKGVKAIAGDLSRTGFIETLPKADVVIHASAIEDGRLSWSEVEAYNYNAANRLFRQSKAWGSERFLLVSSCTLYQHGDRAPRTRKIWCGRPTTANAPRRSASTTL